jgi:hypothetical protein
VARRAKIVRPDSEVPGIGPDGEDVMIPQVSVQALAAAVLEGVQVVNFSGGVLEVIVSRVPTGFPEERVTSAAIVRWKDRTDARSQPEHDGPAITRPPADVAPEDGHDREEEALAVAAAANGGAAVDLDVDESSVPPHLREG